MTAEQRLKFLTNLMIQVRVGNIGPLPAAEQVDRMIMDFGIEMFRTGAKITDTREGKRDAG